MFINLKEEAVSTSRDEDDYRQPAGKPSMPVTPKMLIKALKSLKKRTFKALFFTPREVTSEILNLYHNVEQDPHILFLEISDKLFCAAAAGLIGTKQDLGYYPFDFRQDGVRADSRSELMFWVFYKKILTRKMEEENRKIADERNKGKENQIDTKKSKEENSAYHKFYKRKKY